ncbi:MAG TPA: CopY/TcrY family copper transport repressor [Candidatus Jeotgalibaca pullicola]|nr:CopY/TcrY family copper transport repressor [Candidatus Jeotgalibaca pullicola]
MQAAIDSKITDAEWEVMRVIWTNQPITSKFISEVLVDKMNWKPATIKTLIGRLVEKGFVSTEQEGNRYLYSATKTESESIHKMTKEVIDHVCATKVGSVLADLIEQSLLSKDDVKRLEEVIQSKKADAVEAVPCNCLPGQCDC